ncbi:MAG: hypothetical protein WAM14_27520 [Candidatus Nitrosopolaris sp.]
MTFVGNMTGGKSMMMPGGNMTFGASLRNAKMHLMDLKTGNTSHLNTTFDITPNIKSLSYVVSSNIVKKCQLIF